MLNVLSIVATYLLLCIVLILVIMMLPLLVPILFGAWLLKGIGDLFEYIEKN